MPPMPFITAGNAIFPQMMPLILHPSSKCDVCWESYAPNYPTFIPCGHIFCRSCASNLIDTRCPLCRTAFAVDDVKKLHVDHHDGGADFANDMKELHLLRRMALARNRQEACLRRDVNDWIAKVKGDIDADAIYNAWTRRTEEPTNVTASRHIPEIGPLTRSLWVVFDAIKLSLSFLRLLDDVGELILDLLELGWVALLLAATLMLLYTIYTCTL